MVILKDSDSETLVKRLKCNINQEVYLLKINANEIFETYSINDQKVFRKIGRYCEDGKVKWIENQNIFRRRTDFKGINLKGIFPGRYGIWTKLKTEYETKAPFFSINSTWDVSQHISGVLIESLEAIKLDLNFTTSYYLRKDRTWGNVIQHSNGTLEAFGAVGDVYYDRVDFFAGVLTMTLNRAAALDFVVPHPDEGKLISIVVVLFQFCKLNSSYIVDQKEEDI